MAHPLHAYLALLDDLRAAGFRCHPIRDYFTGNQAGQGAASAGEDSDTRRAYLRHDVDRLPARAVAMAEAEAARGIHSTYYFRCDARGRFPEAAMRRIAALGHETGFHYECLSRTRGDRVAAVECFARELAACRAIVPVTTVSPHGAPLAASSNMDFTASIDAQALGLLGDATDMDFTDMLYVTDTGGTFGSQYNLRDHVAGRNLDHPIAPKGLARRLIDGDERRIVLSCHPERWAVGRLALLEASAREIALNLLKLVLHRARRWFSPALNRSPSRVNGAHRRPFPKYS
ncbi:hypothetical protein [uncultured Thiohalocapsa sp.]|uniref:hypothetical protein n=1 Tax=uncultured Thiohalocapsa sp. TaxID=768990 RepID=UPI0025FD4E35|nr:hypothetical protein [uncultured Thiohalocapsa sp.]